MCIFLWMCSVSPTPILRSLGTLSCPWSCTGGPITFETLSITYCFIPLHDPCGWGLGAFLRWWPPSTMGAPCLNNPIFIAATKQLYDWCSPSVHPSVTMFSSSYHHKIFRSYYHGQKWCPCKRSRSKVKVTEVKTQLSRFWTVTPVWIHIWQ